MADEVKMVNSMNVGDKVLVEGEVRHFVGTGSHVLVRFEDCAGNAQALTVPMELLRPARSPLSASADRLPTIVAELQDCLRRIEVTLPYVRNQGGPK